MNAVPSAASAAEAALARVTARARDVVAALAADPAALDSGARRDDDDGAALTTALEAAVTGLTTARSELRDALAALTQASAAAAPRPPPGVDVDALEASVAALRAEVAVRNTAVRDLSDALAAMVADIDSWRTCLKAGGG